ncbi:DUF1836 domain-containing protein [Limosilactobacillus fermentum]|uniref:DUF1836 domain-containing protein n=1 Tax=Limosilactobacillus fermentum TaxID=1613 RepID=UPI003B97E07C
MMRDLETQMAESIQGFHLPRYGELPAVGLYLEQVTSLINQLLAPLEDVTLTSSMISNYVKYRMIGRPTKRLYQREQVAELVFIAVAKNVLSLDNLKRALRIQRDNYEVAVAYDYFCEELENLLAVVFGFKDQPDPVGKENTEQKRMLENLITAVSHQVYLDKYFAALENED